MKKLFILLLSLTVFLSCKENKNIEKEVVETNPEVEQVLDMHTSQIALDWSGIYKGVLPCADCEGIETEVTLRDYNSYYQAFVFRERWNCF